MATKVEKSIVVDVPVGTAYNQWTQFESFPDFMGGVQQVEQISDTLLHWVAQIAGVKREWDARILEQVPDAKVAWAATSGATNAGAVYFSDAGAGRTSVRLVLEYEPEGVVESVGDRLNIVEKQAESDLEKFKSYIESRGSQTGGWRGSVGEGAPVGTPTAEDAVTSRGDSGKAGVSGTAVAAGAAAVAAVGAVAAAAVVKGRSGDSDESTGAEAVTSAPVAPAADAPGPVPTTYAERADAGTAADSDTLTSTGLSTDTGLSSGGGVTAGLGVGLGTSAGVAGTGLVADSGLSGEEVGTTGPAERYADADRATDRAPDADAD